MNSGHPSPIFEFVLVFQRGQTAKERQLQQASARSHAAKVSHSSKKRPKASSRRVRLYETTAPYQSPVAQSRRDLSVTSLPTPRNIVGDASTDPFCNDGLRQIPNVGRKSLEYVYTVLWPKNYPAVNSTALKSMQATWRRRALEDPLQFHAQVFNATTMCYALSTDPSTMKTLMEIRLKHQAAAVNLIMRLAVQGGDTFRLSTSPRYPESPLANAFNLKPYGRFDTSLPHFMALVELVKQRGGLETLSVSVGHPLQLIDIGIAARLGTHPNFPIRRDFRGICDVATAKFDAEAVALLLATGHGWHVLQEDHPELVELALCGIRLTACLDQSHRRGAGCFPLKDLGILATSFLHDLYELEPALGAGILDPDPIFDIARLALQIYSDLVLFPAAETYRAKDRLCRELLGILKGYFDGGVPNSDEHSALVLWAVVLGATGSESPYHRGWFLRRMTKLVVQLNHRWETSKTSMKQFLWWDYIFEERMKDIWEEAWKTGIGIEYRLEVKTRPQIQASKECYRLLKRALVAKASWSLVNHADTQVEPTSSSHIFAFIYH
ncbi:hypothetical protein H2200_010474 [Cladophialophora chaetospira]|uniref:Tachykinin family protein n=1 Tax=Cladophialophora chaetospira TaxID=386627 RepID=A0AA38X1J8_9EURO|nr:hypothetical protein H2200_010474 [Cladophialophora chaetospira]